MSVMEVEVRLDSVQCVKGGGKCDITPGVSNDHTCGLVPNCFDDVPHQVRPCNKSHMGQSQVRQEALGSPCRTWAHQVRLRGSH